MQQLHDLISNGEIDFETFFDDILLNGFKGFNNMTEDEQREWEREKSK